MANSVFLYSDYPKRGCLLSRLEVYDPKDSNSNGELIFRISFAIG